MWKVEIFVTKTSREPIWLSEFWKNEWTVFFPKCKIQWDVGFEIQPLKKLQCEDLMSRLSDNGGCEIEDKQLNQRVSDEDSFLKSCLSPNIWLQTSFA